MSNSPVMPFVFSKQTDSATPSNQPASVVEQNQTTVVEAPQQTVTNVSHQSVENYPGTIHAPRFTGVLADEGQGVNEVTVCTVEKRNDRMVLITNSSAHKGNASVSVLLPIPQPVMIDPFFPGALPPPDTVSAVKKHKRVDKTKTETLCIGTVDVIGKCQFTYENRQCKILVQLRVTPPGSMEKSIYISKKDMMNPSLLTGCLENEGIVFHSPGKVSYLCEYLVEQYKRAPLSLMNKGFSFNNDRICHSNENEIFKNACEALDCRVRFGYRDDCLNLSVAALLIIGAYSEIRYLLSNINHKVNPLIVLNCQNIDAAKNVLGKAFPNIPQIALGKQMEARLAETDSNLAFIIADSGSSYFADKLVELMDKSGSAGATRISCLPVVVTTSGSLFKSDSDRIINMKLDDSIDANSDRAVFWLMKRLISESGMITLKQIAAQYKVYSDGIDNDPRLNDMSSKFFAALLAIFDIYISAWELETGKHESLVKAMTDYLIETNEGGSEQLSERLKEIFTADMGIPRYDRMKCRSISTDSIILVDNEKICLNNSSLARLSELCGFDKARSFAERLQKEDMLLTDGKLQKKVAIPMAGKSENMYCIDMGKLFEFGEQRIETDEFVCVSPEIQLCLGKNTAGNPVYFTFNKADGSQNTNVYISGSSGCGKSTLLRQWARESARKGLETVIIDTDGQFARELNDENVQVYTIGDEYSISGSASVNTLITAANACAPLSAKQRNELKEVADSLCKCGSIQELFALFDNILRNNAKTSLSEVNRIIRESGILGGKKLDYKAICDPGVISVLDYSELDVMDVKILLDLVLEELFSYKKARQDSGVSVCTLILDEVQNFNLDGLSPLAHQILRQGRKFGISTVMATQYLSSDDAKNIGKLLKQCESFCSFRSANATDTLKLMGLEKNPAAWQCLNSLETGQVIVSGAFSTDRCSIKYPVKVFVENDD